MVPWLKGLIAAIISGVSGAVLVVIGDAATGTTLDWKRVGTVAVIAAVVGAAGYLKQSPIPKDENKLPGP
jgi:hypothetical protein